MRDSPIQAMRAMKAMSIIRDVRHSMMSYDIKFRLSLLQCQAIDKGLSI